MGVVGPDLPRALWAPALLNALILPCWALRLHAVVPLWWNIPRFHPQYVRYCVSFMDVRAPFRRLGLFLVWLLPRTCPGQFHGFPTPGGLPSPHCIADSPELRWLPTPRCSPHEHPLVAFGFPNRIPARPDSRRSRLTRPQVGGALLLHVALRVTDYGRVTFPFLRNLARSGTIPLLTP